MNSEIHKKDHRTQYIRIDGINTEEVERGGKRREGTEVCQQEGPEMTSLPVGRVVGLAVLGAAVVGVALGLLPGITVGPAVAGAQVVGPAVFGGALGDPGVTVGPVVVGGGHQW